MMRAAVVRARAQVWARLGYRGSILGAFGVLELVYGIGVVLQPRYGVVLGVAVLRHLAPMVLWGIVWMACGCVALALSAETRTSHDQWAFGVAQLPPTLWGCANLIAWISGEFPQAYTSVVTWFAFSVIITLVNRAVPGGGRVHQ